MKTKEEIEKEFMKLKFENKHHFGREADSKMIFETSVFPIIHQLRQDDIDSLIEVVNNNCKYFCKQKTTKQFEVCPHISLITHLKTIK
jgi:hypothetical protein